MTISLCKLNFTIQKEQNNEREKRKGGRKEVIKVLNYEFRDGSN